MVPRAVHSKCSVNSAYLFSMQWSSITRAYDLPQSISHNSPVGTFCLSPVGLSVPDILLIPAAEYLFMLHPHPGMPFPKSLPFQCEGGMFRENSIETCILSRVKQITSPGWMHETSARGWCTGKTQRDRVEKEVGGGIEMGNTCKPMADSCQCMAKTTTILELASN